MKRFLPVLLITLMLMGCGFHLRGTADLPPALHVLYLNLDNPYDPVAVGVKETLLGLNVTLVEQPQQAPYSLHLSKSIASNTQPTISDITLATTITFTRSITVSLTDNRTNKIILSKTFTENMVQTLNQNQITTTSTTAVGTQDLSRHLSSDIYIWLITHQVSHAIQPKK